jgi:hypothetical protein
MCAHIHKYHPSANIANYEDLYYISADESILMRGIYKRPPKTKNTKTATRILAISEGHSSRLAMRYPSFCATCFVLLTAIFLPVFRRPRMLLLELVPVAVSAAQMMMMDLAVMMNWMSRLNQGVTIMMTRWNQLYHQFVKVYHPRSRRVLYKLNPPFRTTEKIRRWYPLPKIPLLPYQAVHDRVAPLPEDAGMTLTRIALVPTVDFGFWNLQTYCVVMDLCVQLRYQHF